MKIFGQCYKKLPALLVSTTLASSQVVFADRVVVTPSTPVQKKAETRKRPEVTVKNGHARVLSFPTNIVSVFFSNPDVMSARAINQRTVAITGKAVGKSNLVVSTSRYGGDKVGIATLYTIQVQENSQTSATVDTQKISRVLGRTWPHGDKNFEPMLIEEIEKRDKRIKELEK